MLDCQDYSKTPKAVVLRPLPAARAMPRKQSNTRQQQPAEKIAQELTRCARRSLVYRLVQIGYGLVLLSSLSAVAITIWQNLLVTCDPMRLVVIPLTCFGFFGIARLCLARLTQADTTARHHQILTYRTRFAVQTSKSTPQQLVALDEYLSRLSEEAALGKKGKEPEIQFRASVLDYLLKKLGKPGK
ncbi:MAG: hypothetical protein HXX20_21370 [Chloroflexi bacterium]|nr:hypothetical protein [Chloroflexota bacterium]